MTAILFVFLFSVLLSLLITPVASRIGWRIGALDLPDARKVHQKPTPRSGGLALFATFGLVLAAVALFREATPRLVQFNPPFWGFLAGASLAFITGFIDDIRRLPAVLKLSLHIAAATIAYFSGIHIEPFSFLGFSLPLMSIPLVSYCVTVFWFVLFVNAVNLIDGLDGLAGGICLFVCLVMTTLLVLGNRLEFALLFAILAGSLAGFLRYNFNPASIFLGDGGSYFLGFTIAGLSIMGSVKSQVGAAILIPLISMGVPLFDALFSPVRRFLTGRGIFQPDKSHFHHRLVAMGFSAKHVVLILYGLTFALCLISVLLVNVRNAQVGLLLVVLGTGAFFFLRSLGYFRFLGLDRFSEWLRDLSDASGLHRDRRSFLDLQNDIQESPTLVEMWANVGRALEKLDFDFAELGLRPKSPDGSKEICVQDQSSLNQKHDNLESGWTAQTWQRPDFSMDTQACEASLLKIELPLQDRKTPLLGTLWLIKDLNRAPIHHYTLTRIEHLRRSVTRTLARLTVPSNENP